MVLFPHIFKCISYLKHKKGTYSAVGNAPSVACTRLQVSGSISSPANQAFYSSAVGELVPDLSVRDKGLTSSSAGYRYPFIFITMSFIHLSFLYFWGGRAHVAQSRSRANLWFASRSSLAFFRWGSEVHLSGKYEPLTSQIAYHCRSFCDPACTRGSPHNFVRGAMRDAYRRYVEIELVSHSPL